MMQTIGLSSRGLRAVVSLGSHWGQTRFTVYIWLPVREDATGADGLFLKSRLSLATSEIDRLLLCPCFCVVPVPLYSIQASFWKGNRPDEFSDAFDRF